MIEELLLTLSLGNHSYNGCDVKFEFNNKSSRRIYEKLF